MKTITQTYLIKAPIKKVWQALIDPKIIDDWGAGLAKMSGNAGEEFELWGGDIHGKNLEVIPAKLLVQEWVAGDWEEPSRVTLTLSEKDGKTKVDLLHENIPDKESGEINEGWKRYYLGPMKEYLEMTA